MGEDAATLERMELLLDEAGHGLFANLCTRREGFEFLLDDGVEGALFGAMSRVGALHSSALRVGRISKPGPVNAGGSPGVSRAPTAMSAPAAVLRMIERAANTQPRKAASQRIASLHIST